jgi:hypothetical protein
MLRFPKTRREIRPFLDKLLSNGRRTVMHNRKVVVIAVSCVLTIGVVATAWAFSGDDSPGRPVVKRSERTAPDPLSSGRSLVDAKKYGEAIDVLQPLVDTNVEARFWLGTAHLGAGHDFRGCRQLTKYVELSPKGRYATSAKTRLKKC